MQQLRWWKNNIWVCCHPLHQISCLVSGCEGLASLSKKNGASVKCCRPCSAACVAYIILESGTFQGMATTRVYARLVDWVAAVGILEKKGNKTEKRENGLHQHYIRAQWVHRKSATRLGQDSSFANK